MTGIRAAASPGAKASPLPLGHSWRESFEQPLHEEKQMTAKGTEVSGAGASSPEAQMWEQANWPQIEAEVKRLQMRIAKAVREGRWNKVKSLQRLLTRSHSGKMLAARRVTENRGKKTPGIDGKVWRHPSTRWRGMTSLRHHGYRAMPLRRIYIPKSSGGKRPLGIPCMKDRAMQALWKLALDPIAETLADPNSYGFRPHRGAADAIARCFNALAQRASAQWILEGDIRGCFDNFSHSWILEHIPMDRVILRQWLEAGYVEEGFLFETRAGTPQGGIISPVIANMTLDGLEAAVHASVGKTTREHRTAKAYVVRYADDFVVTGASKEFLQAQVLPAIRRFMAERGLELSPQKTRITHITQGFDFLGQNVRKYGNTLLIKPAKKSIKTLLDKIRDIVKVNSSKTQEALIRHLNPVIRGWAMYHRHVVSKQVFSFIDNHLWHMLWGWAKRRHPNKGARWIKDRYFHNNERTAWNFATKGSNDGTTIGIELFRASTVKIIRHVKIAASAHPFDPQWIGYLNRRRTSKRYDRPLGASLWC
jgi:RNA-directed DNA polymerase